jgi:transcriptional regulator with GAF, ATPase, and Fis domain
MSPRPAPTRPPDVDPDWAALNLVGDSPAFRAALQRLLQWAAVDATVLLLGETGTGKELAARALHYLSPRRAGPFVPVNCAALPDTLLEAELFGHARGAFTDARSERRGLLAQADGGTLFLDEVDALSPRAQAALLRVTQDRSFRPLGGQRQEHSDLRLVAATNANLPALAACGRFRQDLLYRLDLLTLALPPLRERPGDALLLAETFLSRLSHQYGGPARPLSAASRDALGRPQPWPGNVRELEHRVHRAFLLAGRGPVELELGPAPPAEEATSATSATAATAASPAPGDSPFDAARHAALLDFERSYLRAVLQRCGGNLSQAARLAGKERSHFGKLVRKHGLQQPRAGGG